MINACKIEKLMGIFYLQIFEKSIIFVSSLIMKLSYKNLIIMSIKEIKKLDNKQIYSSKKWFRLRHSKHIVSITSDGIFNKNRKNKNTVIFNNGDKREWISVYF
jgi:hypothetical protein